MIISARYFTRRKEWTLKSNALYHSTNVFLSKIKPIGIASKSNRYKIEVSQNSIVDSDAILHYSETKYSDVYYRSTKGDEIKICRSGLRKGYGGQVPQILYVKFVTE